MNRTMKNKRYTKQEIRRNTFYQLPQFVFTDDKYKYQLSPVAKLVYVLLRNRHDLSSANGWADENGEVYLIYTRESLARDLGISVPTASKAMEQLRELNLLEEQKRFNKPNLIYMTFVDIDTYIPPEYLKHEENVKEEKEDIKNDEEEQTTGNDFSSQNEEPFKSGDKDSLSTEEKKFKEEEKKQTAGDSYSSHTENSFKYINKDSLSTEEKKFKPNQTDLKETNYKKTDNLSYRSISDNINDLKIILKEFTKEFLGELKNNNANYQNTQNNQETKTEKEQKNTEQKKKDSNESYTKKQDETYSQDTEDQSNSDFQESTQSTKDSTNRNNEKKRHKKRKNRQRKNNSEQQTKEYNECREVIAQNIEYETIKGDDSLVKDLFEVIVDTVTSNKSTMRVNKDDKPAEVVKSVLLKLRAEHIHYAIECLKNSNTDIRCIRAYMLTTLYNSYSTFDTYYANRAAHDLYNSDCA